MRLLFAEAIMPPHWNPAQDAQLTPVAPQLWLARMPISVLGFRMSACMTVAQLPDGGLWLHSPIALSAALAAQLDALGPVRHIVAPNRFHYLFAADCAARYPHATLYLAPGLAEKVPALAGHPLIPADAQAPWADVLASCLVAGNPELNETVFFHRASGSLIFADLAVWLGPWDGWLTRVYARLNGCYQRLGLSFVLRRFFRDRPAARASLAQVLDWDIQRLIPAHGPVLEHQAKAALAAAFAWLRAPD